MDQTEREFILPREYTAPVGEITDPLPEFAPVPAPAAEAAPAGKNRRYLYIAAALLFASALAPHTASLTLTEEISTAVSPAAAILTVLTDTEETEPPAETVAPTETAAPAPVAAPVDEEPGCDVVFLSFSSSLRGRLLFHGAQAIRSVRVELWEELTDTQEALLEVPAEDIAAGEFQLPEFDVGELYFAHMEEYNAANAFPDPELRVTLIYEGDEGEETLTLRQHAAEEQGWGIVYWTEDEYASEYSYPGFFGLITYESDTPTEVVPGEDVPEGGLAVTVEIDGVPYTPEDFRTVVLEDEGYRYDENGEIVPAGIYYQTYFLFRRPAGTAEGSGVAHFTVRQYLTSFDLLWITEVDVPY